MITNDDISRAASRLSKRLVHGFLRPPAIRGFDGMAYHFKGVDTIHIEPGFDARTTAYIITHESAHILHGTASEISPDLPPGSLELSAVGQWARKVAQESGGNEARADAQAQIWMDYCDKYWRRYPYPDELEARLACLAEYPWQEIIDRATGTGFRVGKATALKYLSENRSMK